MYSELAARIRAGEASILATAIRGPRPGAKLLIPASGEITGSIDPAIDAAVVAEGRSLLAAGQSELRDYTSPAGDWAVFIQSFPPPPRLVIVGAVHTAIPLHRLAKQLGYYVAVVDARSALATPERFPEADWVLTEWPDDALRALHIDSSTAVVVLTHDPKFDEPALIAALASDAVYIGAIGSRGTHESRLESLRAQGVTEEQIARIHAPIGLDIGGKTPAEIALAILAEVIAVRYNRPGGMMRDRAPA